MAANPEIVVAFLADTKDLTRGLNEAGTAGKSFGDKFKGATKAAFLPAVAGLAAVTAGAKSAIDAASGLNEQMSASEQVFGKNSATMKTWAKTGAQAFGLSTRESLAAANAYGNMFNTVGLGSKQVASFSRNMVQLAGDMASFHDQDPTEMLDNLRSALAGETEPLRKFGVLLSEAEVKAFAYREGIAKTGATLTEAQKVQARYGLIMEQTSKAQGDFARTSDSVANQNRTMAATWENTQATLGTALLPAMQKFQTILTAVADVMAAHPGIVLALVGAFTALAAAIVVMNIALTVTAVVASPIALIIIGIVAAVALLAAAAYLLYTNWDTVTAFLANVWNQIKEAATTAIDAVLGFLRANWPLIVGIMLGPLGVIVGLVITHWGQIKNAITTAVDAIKSAVTTGFNAVKTTVVTVSDAIETAITTAWNAAKTVVETAVNAIKTVVAGLTGAFNTAKTAVTSFADALKGPLEAALGVAKGALEGIKSVIGSIAGAFDSAASAVGRLVDAIGRIPSKINLPSIPDLPGPLGRGVPNVAPQGGPMMLGATMRAAPRGVESMLPTSTYAGRPLQVRVYIGDTELRGLVRGEVLDVNTGVARTLLAGAV